MSIKNVKFGGIDFESGTALPATDLNDTFDVIATSKVVTTTISGSDVTSVDFTGLDIDTDGMYVLVMELEEATGTNNTISLYVNDDTTATNYYSQSITAEHSSISGDRLNTARIALVVASTSSVYIVDICKAKATGFLIATSRGTNNSGSNFSINYYAVERASDANITKITITGNQANGIKIGSVLALYRVTR